MKYILDEESSNNEEPQSTPNIQPISINFEDSILLQKLKKGQLIDKIHKEIKSFKDIERQIKNDNLFISIGNNNFISEDTKRKILSILKEEFYKNKSNDKVNMINKLDSMFNNSNIFERDKTELEKIEKEFNNLSNNKEVK